MLPTKKYTITATLKAGTYSSIVLLANCGDILNNNPSLLTDGTPKTDIEQGLTATLGDGSKWNASSTNPTPAPMHGEVSGGSSGIVIGNGQNPFNGIPMTRMTARINLTNNDPGNFTVEHIHLYNLRRSGQVIPGQTPPHTPGHSPAPHPTPPIRARKQRNIHL